MNLLMALTQNAARQARQTNGVCDVDKLRPGTVLVVRSGFGSSAPETVTLEGVEYEGKNGRTTIDYVDKDGDGRWAYADQIVRVITY